MSIDLPVRSKAPISSGVVYDDPSTARRYGRQRMYAAEAKTNAAIKAGGYLYGIMRESHDSRVRQETSEIKADYQKVMRAKLASLFNSGSLEDQENSGKILEDLHDEISNKVYQNNKLTGETIKDYKAWEVGQKASWSTAGTIQGSRMIAANELEKLPAIRRQFVLSRNRKGYEEHLQEADKLISLSKRTAELEKFDKDVTSDIIMEAINTASDNPNAENLSEAQKMIDGMFIDEWDRHRYSQYLRSMVGQKRSLKNATYQARLKNQASQMVSAYSGGKIYSGPLLPETNAINNLFLNRVANGTMDTGDGLTYDMLKEEALGGYYTDEMDLISAYASGMSTEEYAEIKEINAQNKKLTPVQSQQMSTYNEYITTEYQTLKSGLSGKIPPIAMAEVETAVQMDTQNVKAQVRQWIKDGESPERIYKKIQEHFVDHSERLTKNYFMYTWFNTRADELKEDVQELTDREGRYDTIITLYKSRDKADKARLRELLKKWYGK